MKSLAIHTECAVNFNLGDAEPDVPRPVPVGDGQITYELKSKENALAHVALVAFLQKSGCPFFAQAWLGCGCIIHVHAHSKDRVFRLDVPV